jgi:RNase H-like domain found in reverse transcriptase
LLSYPNFNKTFEIFEIHTDASKVQLEACISQDGRPVAFYSRNLNPSQSQYATTERELLSIMGILKEFRNILFGQQNIVHIDWKETTWKSATIMKKNPGSHPRRPQEHQTKGLSHLKM